MIRPSKFNSPYQYFHFNFEYESTGYFKSLDWDFLCHHLNLTSQKWNSDTLALVMMDTHVHLLFRIADSKENFFAADLIKNFKVTNEHDNFVEPIRQQSQFINTYKYIYRNPIEAGLCAYCEEYPYSSLAGLIGHKGTISTGLNLKITDPMGLIQNPIHVLKWLNQKNQMFKYSQLKDLRQFSSVFK